MSNEALDTVNQTTDDRLAADDLTMERQREMRFFDEHPDLERQLVGQWVALDADVLVSHGADLKVVLQQARDAGHPHPFVTRVPDPDVSAIF